MPDISLHHALILAVLLVSIAGLVWISWRMDCRARRLDAQRRAREVSHREAQAALDRAMKRRHDRERNPDFRYTPE